MQTEKSQTEKTQGMRFRNHISIIAEQTGGLLIALLIVLVPSLLENIDELMESGLEFMDGKWLLVNLGLILFSSLSSRSSLPSGQRLTYLSRTMRS